VAAAVAIAAKATPAISANGGRLGGGEDAVSTPMLRPSERQLVDVDGQSQQPNATPSVAVNTAAHDVGRTHHVTSTARRQK